jgi:hypothetical protein
MYHKLGIMADKGYVVLRDRQGPTIEPAEWESLEYMDWKSGGDTNFAPLASATGEMDCRGFWDHGKADKDGIWTENRKLAPSLARYVEEIGGNYGRVRVIKLNPSDEPTALRQLHLDDNNRLNPDGTGWVVRSWLELDDTPGETMFILREDKNDPSTEARVRLHPGMQLVIDTQRLWHVVCHPGPRPRYALITSWESDKVIDSWIEREQLGRRELAGARRLARQDAARRWPPAHAGHGHGTCQAAAHGRPAGRPCASGGPASGKVPHRKTNRQPFSAVHRERLPPVQIQRAAGQRGESVAVHRPA